MKEAMLIFLSIICLVQGTTENGRGCSDGHLDQSYDEDKLYHSGTSLLDSDVSVVENELGCSLTILEFPSGISSAESSFSILESSGQEKEQCDLIRHFPVTSTPHKKIHCVTMDIMDSDISTIEDELGCSLRTEVKDSESVHDQNEHTSRLFDGIHHELTDLDVSDQHLYLDNQPVELDSDGSKEFMDLEQFSNVYAVPHVETNRDVSSLKTKKLNKILSETCIVQDITQPCLCPKRCTEQMEYKIAFKMRRNFWNKPREIRSEQLISQLSYAQKDGRYSYVFLENGNGICIKGFMLLLHLNKNYVTKHKKLASCGNVSLYNKIRQSGSRIIGTISWFENYVSAYGDKMPNTKDVLLPYRTIKKNLYHTYKLETVNPVSESAFYSVWNKHFPHVKIKKTNTFSQCTKCAFLIAKMDNTPSPDGKRSVRMERNYHIQRQMLERKYYYGKKMQSRQQPEEFLSLIIDGMDQSKTDLPHFTGRRAKVINPTDLMGTHITGVLSHGHDLFLNYIDLLEYPHDPNLTINVLLKALLKLADMKGILPPVLYLQADNCRRENKNKYVMAFLELLVRQRIFREVHYSFLYVGHTHEDIDAAFSKISRKLKKHNAETLPDLLELIPNAERVHHIYDVKSWFSDSLCVVSGTSEPLHYKFIADGKNSVKVFYKGQQHTLWKPLNGKGTFLRNIPVGKPKTLEPDFTKFDMNSDKLKKLITSVEQMFSTNEKFQWWNKFISKWKLFTKERRTKSPWLNVLPKQHAKKRKKNLTVIDAGLRKMLDKESAEPQVTCEKRTLKGTKSKQRKLQKVHSRGKPLVKKTIKSQKKYSQKFQSPSTHQKESQGGRRKYRRKHLRTEVILIVPVEDDVKKHIWFIIFFHLLETLVSYSELCMYVFYLLCFVTAVTDIVLLANILWSVLIAQHIGPQYATVADYVKVDEVSTYSRLILSVS